MLVSKNKLLFKLIAQKWKGWVGQFILWIFVLFRDKWATEQLESIEQLAGVSIMKFISSLPGITLFILLASVGGILLHEKNRYIKEKMSQTVTVILAIGFGLILYIGAIQIWGKDIKIPEPTATSEPNSTLIPSALSHTPTSTRKLSHNGECAPKKNPTNRPCVYIMIPNTSDTPYEIAEALFGDDIELTAKYASAIYELLRNVDGYWGGTTRGNFGISQGRILVPLIDEVRDLEYYQEYLGYEECVVPDGDFPCLYVVSEETKEDKINDYRSIARYFDNHENCVIKANEVLYTNSTNYPDQVIKLEDGVVLIIPTALEECSNETQE